MWYSDTRLPFLLTPSVAIDQIEQRKQENPNDIDEVPVEADVFNGRVVLRREAAAQRFLDEPNKQAGAHDHVQGVQAGHAEIEREEKLGVRVGGGVGAGLKVEIPAGNVMLDVFFVILDALDAKKDATEDQGSDEANRQQVCLAHLGSPDGESHGQAAGDENDGVNGAEPEINGPAGLREDFGVGGAIERVGHEQAAEEKHFGGQEDPHAERSGFPLLLHRSILLVQFSGAMHAGLL